MKKIVSIIIILSIHSCMVSMDRLRAFMKKGPKKTLIGTRQKTLIGTRRDFDSTVSNFPADEEKNKDDLAVSLYPGEEVCKVIRQRIAKGSRAGCMEYSEYARLVKAPLDEFLILKHDDAIEALDILHSWQNIVIGAKSCGLVYSYVRASSAQSLQDIDKVRQYYALIAEYEALRGHERVLERDKNQAQELMKMVTKYQSPMVPSQSTIDRAFNFIRMVNADAESSISDVGAAMPTEGGKV